MTAGQTDEGQAEQSMTKEEIRRIERGLSLPLNDVESRLVIKRLIVEVRRLQAENDAFLHLGEDEGPRRPEQDFDS